MLQIMNRIFLILLMCVLPLQFSFAVASTYCVDETVESAEHFGHHQHSGAEVMKKAEIHSDTTPIEKSAGDSDCHFCHSSCANVSIDVAELGFPEFGLPAKVALPLSSAQHQTTPLQRPPIASLA
jgi:hypothetical protein